MGMPIKYDMTYEELAEKMDETNAFLIKGPSVDIDLKNDDSPEYFQYKQTVRNII